MSTTSLFAAARGDSEFFKCVRTLESWRGFRTVMDTIYRCFASRDPEFEGRFRRAKHPAQFNQAVNELFVFAVLLSNGLAPERVKGEAAPDFYLAEIDAYCEAIAPKLQSLSSPEADDLAWTHLMMDILRDQNALAQYDGWCDLTLKDTARLTATEAQALPGRLERTLGRLDLDDGESVVLPLESGTTVHLTRSVSRTPRPDGSAIGLIDLGGWFDGDVTEQCLAGLRAKADKYRSRPRFRPLIVAVSGASIGGDPTPVRRAAETFFSQAELGVVDGLLYFSFPFALWTPDRIVHVPSPQARIGELELSEAIRLP